MPGRQAVVCPLLRGSSPTRGVAPKQHRGLRRAFSPAFFGTGSLDPLAGGCRTIWRGVILVYWFWRRDAARPDRAAWAVPRRRSYDLLVSAARVNLTYPPYARGGADGQAVVCYGVARQREGSRQNSIRAPACFLSGIFRGWFSLSLGAWVPNNLARRNFGLLVLAARC